MLRAHWKDFLRVWSCFPSTYLSRDIYRHPDIFSPMPPRILASGRVSRTIRAYWGLLESEKSGTVKLFSSIALQSPAGQRCGVRNIAKASARFRKLQDAGCL